VKAQTLIDQALAELKLTKYGWPKTNKPTGHMENVVTLLGKARASLDPPPKPPKPKVDLGPVIKGGVPILQQDLTHETGGLTGFPAFDDGIGHPGMVVIAPETVTITGHGHAVRRDGTPNGLSLNLAVGASGIRYWIGHLENLAPIGAKVKKGGQLATISPNHEAPHVHVGIDAAGLIGHELLHHTDYTHGAPTVGAQLKAAGF
jgi:hypothetical protein